MDLPFLDSIFDIKPDRCEECNSEEKVEKVYVSSFSGRGQYKYLCQKCRLMEKVKVY